ncbi:hypothetical protein [Neobacillus cucumis]|jgi:hypothetical protein|uniref:hypothetical protein n=1 Tax=Neobacillus cucumis TaxID=1740721 RepID=UPI002E22E45C|nr:hypothetical protein [Neobacillus cucumis]
MSRKNHEHDAFQKRVNELDKESMKILEAGILKNSQAAESKTPLRKKGIVGQPNIPIPKQEENYDDLQNSAVLS